VTSELGRVWKEDLWSNIRSYHSICLVGMNKTMITHVVWVLAETQTKHLQKHYSLNQHPWFVVLTCREKRVDVCVMLFYLMSIRHYTRYPA